MILHPRFIIIHAATGESIPPEMRATSVPFDPEREAADRLCHGVIEIRLFCPDFDMDLLIGCRKVHFKVGELVPEEVTVFDRLVIGTEGVFATLLTRTANVFASFRPCRRQ